MRALCYVTCCILLAGMILAITSIPTSNADRATNASYKCEIRYDMFRSLGEAKFVEKYRGTSILSDCLKLYKNPNWSFSGKNKIDRHYEKKPPVEKTLPVHLEVLSKKAAGNGKYSLSYKVCVDKQISHHAVLISSGFERFLASSHEPIPSKTCKAFQVTVKSVSPNDIIVRYIENIKDPALKSVQTARAGAMK
jgi:hypothetical protein